MTNWKEREKSGLFKALYQHSPGATNEKHAQSYNTAGLWTEFQSRDLPNTKHEC